MNGVYFVPLYCINTVTYCPSQCTPPSRGAFSLRDGGKESSLGGNDKEGPGSPVDEGGASQKRGGSSGL